jgi:FAD-linked oxidoreductase
VSRTRENWSGTARWQPSRAVAPPDLESVVRLVDDCRRSARRLRVIGAGHSFTPLVATDDTSVSLREYRGLIGVDRDAGTATVRAGTGLAELGERLWEHGVAQENLGDVDRQAIAGAVATGTHGTGEVFGSISTQVEALRLVTPTGDVLEISPERRSDWLPAAAVSLGLLGVIVELRLRVVPAFHLRYRHEARDLDDLLADLDGFLGGHRHAEFHLLPHGWQTQAKTQDVVDDEPTSRRLRDLNETVIENGVLWLASQATRAVPSLSRAVGRISGRLVGTVEGVDRGHRVFATRRWVRFAEMEYCIPREHLPEALEDIRRTFERERFPVHFPIEVRTVAADGLWLSPSYQRRSAYLAFHVFRGKPHERYFRAMEEIVLAYDGRPHWGKLHTLEGDALRARYPRFDDFLALREELDPDGMLLTPYLERLLGV